MAPNPYESPTNDFEIAVNTRSQRLYASLIAGLAAVAFLMAGFCGLIYYAFLSIVDPRLEGADRSREIASKMFHLVAFHAICVGYLLVMCGLLSTFLVFIFVGIFGTPPIRRGWRIVLVSGACLAIWIYGYIVACSYGWIDSYFIK